MRALAISARKAVHLMGYVLCHNVFDPARPKSVVLRKGHIIRDTDAYSLQQLRDQRLHLLELGPDDVLETEAGLRLASAAAGSSVQVAGESESQVRLTAATRGLLRVDAPTLQRLHELDSVLVWTLEDRTPVDAGRHIGSAKIAPLAVSRALLEEAESRLQGGVISVSPYANRRVLVVVREQMDARAREKFEASIRRKISWFGAEAPRIVYTAAQVESVVNTLSEAITTGADLVLVGGTGSTDPLDPVFVAIERLGGRVLRWGVPAHPGSTYWLAQVQGMPVLGLASCGMFSQMTALDLLLPRFYSGEEVTPGMLTSLAVGGLIGRERTHLFPQYEQSTVHHSAAP